MKNPLQLTVKRPQYLQQNTLPGICKGIVVDVRDPYRQGRVRVQCYPLNGDYKNTDVESLYWTEPMHPGRAFQPPELGDRVLISFEAGDRYSPMYLGHLTASPRGRGQMPWNKRQGTEIRPEAWHHHDLYPESRLLSASGNGNAIWMQDIFLTKDNTGAEGDLCSSLHLQDTAGKFFRIRSIQTEVRHWSPVLKYDQGSGDNGLVGSLYKTDYGETKALRTGTETPSDLDPEAGSIELAMPRVQTELIGSKGDFSVHLSTQYKDQDTLTHDRQAVGGQIYSTRQETSLVAQMDDLIALVGQVLSGSRILQPPRRWDDQQAGQSSGGSSAQGSVQGSVI